MPIGVKNFLPYLAQSKKGSKTRFFLPTLALFQNSCQKGDFFLSKMSGENATFFTSTCKTSKMVKIWSQKKFVFSFLAMISEKAKTKKRFFAVYMTIYWDAFSILLSSKKMIFCDFLWRKSPIWHIFLFEFCRDLHFLWPKFLICTENRHFLLKKIFFDEIFHENLNHCFFKKVWFFCVFFHHFRSLACTSKNSKVIFFLCLFFSKDLRFHFSKNRSTK